MRLFLPCSAWRKWTKSSKSLDFGTELQNMDEFIYDAKFHHSHFFAFILKTVYLLRLFLIHVTCSYGCHIKTL
jgi:hypothetical protein